MENNFYDEIINFENAKEMETMMENITNYESTKANIKVRMYNNTKELTSVTRSAEEYGFEDLVITPVIELGETPNGFATIKVTKDIIDAWGVTEDEVFEQGIENLEYTFKGMGEMMTEMMIADGMPADLARMMVPEEELMWIVSNKNTLCGASSIIKAKAELEKRFPNGYVVIPSSIHEVIVVPITDDLVDRDALLSMVKEVNGGCVSEDERLADNVYEFRAA